MTRSLYAACGAALLIGGCSFTPPPIDLAMPVPQAWPNALDATDGEPARAIGWRGIFADPALQAVIAQALENNRDLRIAVLRVEEARAAYRIQAAQALPAVNGQAGLGRGQTPADLTGVGRSLTATQYSADLNLSWELDFWGRVRSLEGAALERWLASEEGARAATVSLTAAVAATWVSVRELDERIALADRTLETRRDAARIARRRYEVGSSSRFDMVQAETLLAQAESERISLEQAREQALNGLALVVGAPVETSPAPLAAVEQAMLTDLPAGLPSRLLADRPDIRAAEHALRAAEGDIGAARAAYFPRIALTGLLGSASTDLDHLFSGPENRQWSLAGAASAPIFDAGRTRANVTVATVRREIAVADYERTVQTAFREVSDALAARRNLARQVEVGERSLAALTERSRLAQLRYANGAAAYLEVLDAERDRFAAEQALVVTRAARLSNQITLYAALGGGDLGAVPVGQRSSEPVRP